MSLPEFSIRRPVTTVMIFAGILLFGFISLSRLPQELFPPIIYPQLTVVTTYENAAPEEIETLITKPVEEAIGTVSGLRRVKSISKEGLSLVMAEFGWSQNMDFAALRMREKIDLIKERLPRESEEPLVMKYNPFEMPIMVLSVIGDRSPQAIREISRRIIKDELEKIEGVASATITGGLEREIIVEVDQGRLRAHNVPLLSVARSIADANLNYPAGTIKESFYEYLIRTLGEFKHVNEIEEIAVKIEKDKPEGRDRDEEEEESKISKTKKLVLLKDVGTVTDTVKERTSFSRYKGEENISVSIQKQAQVNTLQVVNRVKEALDVIRTEAPDDIKIQIVSDQSKFIKDAINGVRDAAFQGGILAFLVLLLFLRNVRSSIIVTFSIPISIIAIFTLMYWGKLSINMMSLGGLALGVGMLVDSAIVVLENITRHKELGEDDKAASITGANEVSNAITASTFTTVVVFFPMVFVVGIAGQIFKQLAFTVIFSLVASLFVALTLIPLLVSRKDRKAEKKHSEASTQKDFALLRFYENALLNFLRVKKIGLFVVLLIFLGSLFLFIPLDKELMPKIDQGQFMVKVDLPSGTRLEITDRVAKRIEEYLTGLPYVEDISSIVGSTRGKEAKDVLQRLGSHQAEIRLTLKKKRKIKTQEAVQSIKNHMEVIGIEGADVDFILQESIFSAAVEESAPIIVEIKGQNMPILTKITEKLMKKIEKIKGVYGVKTDMPEPSPEAKVFINKDKASLYNLSVFDIAQTAQIGLKGYIASQLKEKGQEIDIRVRLREKDRDDFNKLSRLQVHSPDGHVVPLFTVAKFGKGKGPSEIKRLDQERTILILANIFKRPLKDVISDITKAINKLDIPADFTVKLAGESEEMNESFNSLIFALVFSIILVYMIMAAQFESFFQPFIIMVTVPLSIIGVVLALFVTGTSVNVVAFLGVIMLGGIVVNNGIVLIDYVNLLRAQGKSVYDSVVEASKARLRPILMTAMTTILGLVPMALAIGEGSELRSPLAISVIGGLFVSTFLTLLVVPAIYLLSHEVTTKLFKK
ncbi:MAG: efflux RND transporter permease subunit [Candidatus Omnitrophica bacterium]|nr:efflux RND transporter permease subunit [Candidatus Omnitrophota bacterium]